MGRACSTNGGEGECIYWWGIQKERDHWEYQDVGGGDNIKMDFREIGWDGGDWIDLTLDRDYFK
jgi:hypothetical protein